MGAADEEPRCRAAGSLPARHLDRRFPGGVSALLGKDAPNLSPSVIGQLKEEWTADYDRWQRRDLSARRYSIYGPTGSICRRA